MKSLFNENFLEILNYKNAYKKTIGDPDNIENIFSRFPTYYFRENYSEIIDNIEKDNGFKVRVPITNTKQMLELSKTLPLFCDNVIFSPAPLWPSCRRFPEKPWPELTCDGSIGYSFDGGCINFWDTTYIPGLVVLKPLIEKGDVTILPQYGESLHIWDYPKLNLPSLPAPYLEPGGNTPEKIIETVLYQLYMDNIVSSKLGCMHLLSSSRINKIGITGTPSWNIASNTPSAYALMKLKIPYIKNLSYEEIARIKEEEYDHFESFRDGIKLALNEISEDIDSTSRLDQQVAKIQRNLIDEPLKELESRLTRLTKYQSYRMAGYTIASTSMLLTTSLSADIFKISTQAIGTISILKVFENYVSYLEKKSEIESNSIFYLLKAKRLGEKK